MKYHVLENCLYIVNVRGEIDSRFVVNGDGFMINGRDGSGFCLLHCRRMNINIFSLQGCSAATRYLCEMLGMRTGTVVRQG